MARVTVKYRLYRTATASIVGGLSRAAARQAANVTLQRAQSNIIRAGRVDTGRMYTSLRIEESRASTPERPRFLVKNDLPYTRYQEFGTRGHGPVRAKFLRFKPKGSSKFVYTKWVRGVTPARFMRDALEALRPEDYLPRGR